MWFFMNACYIMSLLTILGLFIGFAQSFFHFPVVHANHVTFMIFVSILYAFTETLIIFFFVGTGVSIKEYTQQNSLDHSFHRQSIAVKRIIYPPQMLNILFLIILFVMVGAVDTHRIPAWIYQTYFIFCIADYLRNKVIQNKCFRENTKIILNMSGIKHGL